MDKLRVSTAQFENRSGDKAYNLGVNEKFSKKAASDGSQVMAFHECSITCYNLVRHLSKEQMLEITEIIPSGESIERLKEIAQLNDIVILAGLFKKDKNNHLFKAYN